MGRGGHAAADGKIGTVGVLAIIINCLAQHLFHTGLYPVAGLHTAKAQGRRAAQVVIVILDVAVGGHRHGLSGFPLGAVAHLILHHAAQNFIGIANYRGTAINNAELAVISGIIAAVIRLRFRFRGRGNYCGSLADAALSAEALASASSGTVFLGTVFYMLQIYLDFSAYSDMAIGMGLMCGLHYCENFNYPYCAASATDFWRRWHISLSTFFRDYVYIPLGGNRHGRKRQLLNMLAVWLLTGLWHGASWNYVLWGLYWFVWLAGEKLFLHTPYAELPLWKRILRHCGLLAGVWFGWMLFYFEDLSLFGSAIADLFFRNGFWDLTARLTLLNNLFFLAVAVAACTPLLPAVVRRVREAAKPTPAWRGFSGAVAVAAPVVLLVLSFLSLVGNTYNPFLYFQF